MDETREVESRTSVCVLVFFCVCVRETRLDHISLLGPDTQRPVCVSEHIECGLRALRGRFGAYFSH